MRADFAVMGRFDAELGDGGSVSVLIEWYEAMVRPKVVYFVSDVPER